MNAHMRQERVGFAMCGSFCTHEAVLNALRELAKIYENIIPIVSDISAVSDTRFGDAEKLLQNLKEITGRDAIQDIIGAEPIGPKKLLDILIIAPATGNTIAKLAGGITDSAVTMAAKAHLRNNRPIVIAVSSNDGLAAGAKNIGELLVRKNYYFVPFRQDDPIKKPTSLVADFTQIPNTIDAALNNQQIQPILI